MSGQQVDTARVEAFASQMIGVLNGAMLSLMTSIGHQTGLFDAMAGLPPSTSERIAEAARLNERYVREWLGAMVTGHIVEYDPAGGTYRLPPEHAACLTRAAGPDNLALFTQYISLFGGVEQDVIHCFRNGGGVPYSAYPRFQRLQAEESAAIFDATLIQRTLPAIPGVVERLQAGIEVADFGCGLGRAVNLIAQAFPKSRCAGYDISDEGVAEGRAEAARLGLANARFEVQDIAAVELGPSFDLITAFDAIHDQVWPRRVLNAISRALRPDGVFLMVDIAASSNVEDNLGIPFAPALYSVSVLHCMTVSLSGGGEGLGAMWGEQKARELLTEAGFHNIEVMRIEGDLFNNYYIARK